MIRKQSYVWWPTKIGLILAVEFTGQSGVSQHELKQQFTSIAAGLGLGYVPINDPTVEEQPSLFTSESTYTVSAYVRELGKA